MFNLIPFLNKKKCKNIKELYFLNNLAHSMEFFANKNSVLALKMTSGLAKVCVRRQNGDTG